MSILKVVKKARSDKLVLVNMSTSVYGSISTSEPFCSSRDVVIGSKFCSSFFNLHSSLALALINVPLGCNDTYSLIWDSFTFKKPMPISRAEILGSNLKLSATILIVFFIS